MRREMQVIISSGLIQAFSAVEKPFVCFDFAAVSH